MSIRIEGVVNPFPAYQSGTEVSATNTAKAGVKFDDGSTTITAGLGVAVTFETKNPITPLTRVVAPPRPSYFVLEQPVDTRRPTNLPPMVTLNEAQAASHAYQAPNSQLTNGSLVDSRA